MDPATQGLLGAAAAQALFGNQLGRSAGLIGAVGGLLPDADVLIKSRTDPLLAVEVHRQFTHALAFIPIGGAIASLPWMIHKKYRQRWILVLGASVAAYATHGLLDACTTYGTQLLWPFSSARIAWNVISIVDPLFTLTLFAGVVASAWLRRRWPAVAALVLCVAYLGLGNLQRNRALAAQAHVAEMRDHEPARRAVFPTLGNLLVWRSLYQAGDSLYADRIRVPFAEGPQWRSGTVVPDLDLNDLPARLRQDVRIQEDFRRFRWFSGGWVARAPDDSTVVGDARYSLRTDRFEPIWGVRFHPESASPTEWVNRTRDRELRLRELWDEIADGAGFRKVPRR